MDFMCLAPFFLTPPEDIHVEYLRFGFIAGVITHTGHGYYVEKNTPRKESKFKHLKSCNQFYFSTFSYHDYNM